MVERLPACLEGRQRGRDGGRGFVQPMRQLPHGRPNRAGFSERFPQLNGSHGSRGESHRPKQGGSPNEMAGATHTADGESPSFVEERVN